MDEAEQLDVAVAAAFEVVWRMARDDLAAGVVPQRRVAVVQDMGFPFAIVDNDDGPDWLAWVSHLGETDRRVLPLQQAQALFATLAHVPPYDTRSISGWEVIAAIALAAQTFDFRNGAEFSVAQIQLRVRDALLFDRMAERTTYALYGFAPQEDLQVGERAWLLPATEARKTYLANPREFLHPFVDAHFYLVVDHRASYSDMREAKHDPLPSRLVAALRAVVRSDLFAFGPLIESIVILPSRFAGFGTLVRRPSSPNSYSAPNADVPITKAEADEVAVLDSVCNGAVVAKELKSDARSLRLALGRLSNAAIRTDAPDAFLDLMIALEALLTIDGEKSEITYRIGLRGAMSSAGATPEQRLQTKKMLSAAYNLRSEIVHGGKRELTISAAATKELREYVARMIRLSAFGIVTGTPLVAAIESALLGDATSLQALKASLRGP